MRIYKIGPGAGAGLQIYGDWDCRIGRLDCPVCGWWSDSGVTYPTIGCAEIVSALGDDVDKFLEHTGHRRKPHIHMTVADYTSLNAILAPILGQNRPLKPGAAFGPLRAKVRGEVHDFAWWGRADIFARESVFTEMQEAGFPVVGASANLTFSRRKQGSGEPMIQLEVPPVARMGASASIGPCNRCGRPLVTRKTIVDHASFDQSIPVQRLYEVSTPVLISDALCKFIRTRRYSGIKLSIQASE